ncbi:MAG TPA: hypothetical protein VGA69_02585 [Nitriliruptorales bacterium]
MVGTPLATDRRLRVIWQGPTREFHQVGVLTLPADPGTGVFRFEYVHPLPSDFHPFLAFPDPDRPYESPTLFAFFSNRVMSAERPEFDDHLAALGLTRGQATPFEILSRTSGRRTTDAVQVVPEPSEDADGTVRQLFLASGVRYQPDVEATLAELRAGDRLELVDDPDNDFDPCALLLSTRTGDRVGYVPSYLLDEVRKLREEGDLAVSVVRANGRTVPWHLRLLCQMEARRR